MISIISAFICFKERIKTYVDNWKSLHNQSCRSPWRLDTCKQNGDWRKLFDMWVLHHIFSFFLSPFFVFFTWLVVPLIFLLSGPMQVPAAISSLLLTSKTNLDKRLFRAYSASIIFPVSTMKSLYLFPIKCSGGPSISPCTISLDGLYPA